MLLDWKDWCGPVENVSSPRKMTEPRTCKVCGASFMPTGPSQTHCKSNECKRARTRARWEEWKAREEEKGTFRDKLNTYQREYRSRTNYERDYELRTKYGINLEEWLNMLDAVNNLCELCGTAKENLCVDHDHATGKVRGVLCRSCNRALGQLGDTLEVAQRLVVYLSRVGNVGFEG